MRDLTSLLALPAAILALIDTIPVEAQELQWPYNLPRSARYYPEHEEHVRKGLEAQQKLVWESPKGMRKMSDDPGEKFYLHYWEFEGDAVLAMIGERLDIEELSLRRLAYHQWCGSSANVSMLLPAVLRHANPDSLLGRSLFTRDYQCLSGTERCDNLNSDLCCQTGETCVNTSDGVGCCPPGASCSTDVAGCDTASGYTSCVNDNEGGCCVPGAACVESGCAFYGTATVTTTLPISTVRPTDTYSSNPASYTTVIAASATTVTITISGETVTVTQPTTIVIAQSSGQRSCTAGFQSCPASLGGGCCRSEQICATDSGCYDITTTTSATAYQPVQPTTVSTDSSVSAADTETTPTTTPASSPVEGCPTGYYMCSAVYLGGCCQVDRNCDTTSCPSTASTNVVTSGVTIAAAGGSGTVLTGACASGWQTCGANVGGGCCPSGYQCSSNCINTAPGGSDTLKQAPQGGGARVETLAWSFLAVGLGAAFGMIWL